MTIMNRITGVIQLTRPLHCASPDESLKPQGKEGKTFTPTTQQRIMTRAGLQRVPYFPGNDLRGRLRRKAAAIVLDHVTASTKISAELYAGLSCGAVSAKPENDVTVEEVLRARDNVYMGLFGGGTRILRSRFRVADLLPIIAATVESGGVPARYAEADTEHWLPKTGSEATRGEQLLVVQHLLRVDDVMRVLRPDELERYIQDAASAVTSYQVNLLGDRVKRKEGKKKAEAREIAESEVQSKSDVGNMLRVQAIAAGTPMYFQLDFLDDASDAHVGLMLMALRDLVREQALGGWVRTGFGQFAARLTLQRNGDPFDVFATRPAGAEAELSPAVDDRFVVPARKALGQLTADQMMEFFTARQSTAEAEEA